VPLPDFPLTILEFQQRFGTEEACREYLFASRWPDGFICPACGGGDAGEETRRCLWVCTTCGHQTSITAGTVMHKTRLPLRTWFWAAYLVSTFQPGISAKQLQRQLGLGCHETAWAMLHKLRAAMVAPGKGGRQHGKKVLCGAAVEVRGQGSGRLRLQVLENSQAKTLEAFTTATTARGAIVHTDGLPSYNGLVGLGYEHRPRNVASVGEDEKLLPRLHRAISNLKAWMHGTHRSVSPAHMQVYLDEFVFRHNRRGTLMASFQTLLGFGLDHGPVTYREIIDRAA
jgi:hypothetical protein